MLNFRSLLSAWVGAVIAPDNSDLYWLLEQSSVKRLFEPTVQVGYIDTSGQKPGGSLRFRLTMEGWERYEALRHAEVASRSVFMAMKFGDAELDNVVNGCFKGAVKRAGFVLRPMTEGQPAGLIDDQLRVALRTSRLAIADLSHGNHGAYWEAGFAEGLGRPVIYTCKRKVWDERNDSDPNKVKSAF